MTIMPPVILYYYLNMKLKDSDSGSDYELDGRAGSDRLSGNLSAAPGTERRCQCHGHRASGLMMRRPLRLLCDGPA